VDGCAALRSSHAEKAHSDPIEIHNTATAQPGIAADRFAREIVGFMKARSGALAAAECQPVGRASRSTTTECVERRPSGRMPTPIEAPAPRRERERCFLGWPDSSATVPSHIPSALGSRSTATTIIGLGTPVAVFHFSLSVHERLSNGRPGGRFLLLDLWDHCLYSCKRYDALDRHVGDAPIALVGTAGTDAVLAGSDRHLLYQLDPHIPCAGRLWPGFVLALN
jgi:hypothetical protein